MSFNDFLVFSTAPNALLRPCTSASTVHYSLTNGRLHVSSSSLLLWFLLYFYSYPWCYPHTWMRIITPLWPYHLCSNTLLLSFLPSTYLPLLTSVRALITIWLEAREFTSDRYRCQVCKECFRPQRYRVQTQRQLSSTLFYIYCLWPWYDGTPSPTSYLVKVVAERAKKRTAARGPIGS